MKLTNTSNMKAFKPGMTLLELTVVILVLLSLISILFIGARAWKRGSDRAASILMIRNVQQAVRSNANMSALNTGDPMVLADIFGAGKFLPNNPVLGTHPAGTGTSYAYGAAGATTIPAVGVLYMVVTGTDNLYYMPAPASVSDW